MAILMAFDFDGVHIAGKGKNHNNAVVRMINAGVLPEGANTQAEAYELLHENPLRNEVKEWLDKTFQRTDIKLVQTQELRQALQRTVDGGSTPVILSASAFPEVINYMVEQAGLSDFFPRENIHTVNNKVQALIPGLKAAKAKELAENLEYTDIVFLDDNINNVKAVGELNGVDSLHGTLSVTAIKVDPLLGLNDTEILEQARAKELEYNMLDALKQFDISPEEPLYQNNAEALAALNFAEEPIFQSLEELNLGKPNLIRNNSPVQDDKRITDLKAVVAQAKRQDQSKPANVAFLKAAEKSLENALSNPAGVVPSIKGHVEVADVSPSKAEAKTSKISKFLQIFKKSTKQNDAVQLMPKVDPAVQSRRRDTLKRLKRESVVEKLTHEEYSKQLTPDLNKFTGPSIQLLERKSPSLPKDGQNQKGIGQEKPKVAPKVVPKGPRH
jgi:hypothetical protein